MKRTLSSLLASLPLIWGATTLQALELSYSTHLPPSVAVNSHGIIPLFEAVEADTDGEVTVKYFWAGALFAASGNFTAVKDGVVDAAFTQPSSNQAEMRINTLFTDLYLYGRDPYVTAAAYAETILLDCEDCRQEYADNNAVFFGAHAATPSSLICGDPVNSLDDLRGKRIIGQPGLTRWIQDLGGTQLDIAPPSQMEAIQRGQADCSIVSREWLAAFSLADVAHTVVDVPTGSQFAISVLTFNKNTWDGLPENVRQSFLRNIPVAIGGIIDAYVARENEVIEAAKARGIVFVDLDGDYEARFESFMEGFYTQALANAETRGIPNAEATISTFVANLDKWEGLIAEHGLGNYAELLYDEIYSQLPY